MINKLEKIGKSEFKNTFIGAAYQDHEYTDTELGIFDDEIKKIKSKVSIFEGKLLGLVNFDLLKRQNIKKYNNK